MFQIYNIAIIGSGPAGIAAAIEAVNLGIDKVTVFEKMGKHSWTIRKYYKDNKRVDKDYKGKKVDLIGNIDFLDGTKESTLDLFDQMLHTHQIDAKFYTNIETISKGEDGLFHIKAQDLTYRARNVIIAIGNMGKPNKPSYKIPREIKKKVNFNLEECTQDEKVIVVGGGNSAAEYAYDLSHDNAATLCYRRQEFSRVNDENLKNILRANNEGKLELKLGVDIVSLEATEDEKIKVNFDDETCEIYDRAVYAIGGSLPTDFLRSCGVEMNDKNQPIYDDVHECTSPGLFIAGDLAAAKGGSIAAALNHGHVIVQHIKENRL